MTTESSVKKITHDKTIDSLRLAVFPIFEALDTNDKFQYYIFESAMRLLNKNREKVFEETYDGYKPEFEKENKLCEKYENVCSSRSYPARILYSGFSGSNSDISDFHNSYKKIVSSYNILKDKSKLFIKHIYEKFDVKNTLFLVTDLHKDVFKNIRSTFERRYLTNNNFFNETVDCLDYIDKCKDVTDIVYELSYSFFGGYNIHCFADFDKNTFLDNIQKFKYKIKSREVEDIKVSKICVGMQYYNNFNSEIIVSLLKFISHIICPLSMSYFVLNDEEKDVFIDRLLTIDRMFFKGFLLLYIKLFSFELIHEVIESNLTSCTNKNNRNKNPRLEVDLSNVKQFINDVINSGKLNRDEIKNLDELDKYYRNYKTENIDLDKKIKIVYELIQYIFDYVVKSNMINNLPFTNDKVKGFIKTNISSIYDLFKYSEKIKLGDLKSVYNITLVLTTEIYRTVFLLLFSKELNNYLENKLIDESFNYIQNENLKEKLLSFYKKIESTKNKRKLSLKSIVYYLHFSHVFSDIRKLLSLIFFTIKLYDSVNIFYLDVKFKGVNEYKQFIALSSHFIDMIDVVYFLYSNDDIINEMEIICVEDDKINIELNGKNYKIYAVPYNFIYHRMDGITYFTAENAENTMIALSSFDYWVNSSTLFVTPTLNSYLEKFKEYVKNKYSEKPDKILFIDDLFEKGLNQINTDKFRIINICSILNNFKKHEIKSLLEDFDSKYCKDLDEVIIDDVKFMLGLIDQNLIKKYLELTKENNNQNCTNCDNAELSEIERKIISKLDDVIFNKLLNRFKEEIFSLSLMDKNIIFSSYDTYFADDYTDLDEEVSVELLIIPVSDDDVSEFYLNKILVGIDEIFVYYTIHLIMSVLSVWLLTNHGILISDINKDNYDDLLDEISRKLEYSDSIPNYASYCVLCSDIYNRIDSNNMDLVNEILDFYVEHKILTETSKNFILNVLDIALEIGYFLN